ncbi:hypothetical protein [Peribacillus simplex]|uniref:hypothetical protein n=1 Tax=Peribacillus simplex TaxID=1478 RepID=UPI003F4EA9F7
MSRSGSAGVNTFPMQMLTNIDNYFDPPRRRSLLPRIPDFIFGRTTLKKVPKLLAPRLSAASSMIRLKSHTDDERQDGNSMSCKQVP